MKRGKGELPSVNPLTEQTIRFAGFLVPVLLFVYGLLVVFDILPSGHAVNLPMFCIVGAGWLALSIYQFMIPVRKRIDAAWRLVAYHLLAILYILFVTGIDMPFTPTWAILLLAAYTYFGNKGLYLSLLALFGVTIGEIALNIGNLDHLAQIVLYFLVTLIVSYIAGILNAAQEVDRRELSRSQAQEMLQRDRVLTIVNNLADAVLSTDKEGVIQLYNAASLNLLDTNSELTGQHIDTALHLIDTDNKSFKLRRAFKVSRIVESRDDLSATISGETLHLSVIYSPIRSTNSHDPLQNDGYIVILRDITKQKSLEEERDEFISVVSHELRTPITIAEGSLDNVQVMMGRDDIPKTTLADSVKAAHDQVLFLARMVNDLSTLSRAERGVADTAEEIDVSQMVHDLYNEYAPQAQAKGLKLNLDLSPKLGLVSASRLYLKELLQNFVTNAIKYTKEGTIIVSIHVKDGVITFAVKDSGIGISKSDQVRIFDKFYRSEDYRTRETGGTGLGLYVARKLSKKLGTTIELKSRLNHGSTFWFTLPTLDK
ncbi:MAG: ATP-binding protein [Candidatus Saccharimonas sp.]